MRNKPSACRRLSVGIPVLLTGLLLSFSLSSVAWNGDKAIIGFKRAVLEEVFQKIEKTFDVRFTYDPTVIKSSTRFDLPEKERSLDEVLQAIRQQYHLKFLQSGKLIGVQRSEQAVNEPAQIEQPVKYVADITVQGTVKDNQNQPMEGVAIRVKGSIRGTATNAEGFFTITVPQNAVLQISSVGYAQQEVIIRSATMLNIVLLPTDRSLDEVVVTALGIKKEKKRVAYSTQEVKGKDLEKARESSVLSTLTGKVAGLSILNKSTLFETPDVTLRGGKPIVVIDGVPVTTNFWNINADDIDNINVLKGTAATVLYGSLGKDGAIMITTKKGKAGANGVEVTFNSTNQFQAGYLKIPETQTDYGMGWAGQYAYEDGRGGGWYDDYGYVYGPKLNQKDPSTASGFVEIPQFNGVFDPNGSYTTTFANGDQFTGHVVPTPWITRSQSNLKKFLRNEFLTTNNFSIAGKTDKSEYRISLTHFYQMGQVPNTHLNSSTLSLGGSLKVTDKLKVEATVSYNKQYTPNYPVTGYGPDNFFYNVMLWMGPEVDINDMRNYWKKGKEGTEQQTYNYTWYNNPWFLAYERLRSYNRDAIVSQVNATYDFTKDFSALVRTGISVNNSGFDVKTPYSFINYGNSKAPFGNYEITKQNQLRVVTDALFTYKKNFLKEFSATVSGGVSSRFEQFSELYSATNGLNVPELYNLSNSISPVNTTNKLVEKQVNSVLGYAELSYRNMVFLNISGRNDWTSSLQKPNNSFFYPSVSLGLIASDMIQMPVFISYFKLRGSWANISTDNIHVADNIIDEYATLPVYNTDIRWNGQSSLNLPGQLINPNLAPNKTISQEYGAELRFLNNRLGIDFTYYSYLDKDFVVAVPVSAASGYNQLIVNGDKVNRRGIEIIATATPVKTKDLRWDVILNYTRHREIQKEYYGGDSIRDLVPVGGRRDVLGGYKWDRSPDGQIVYDGGIPQYVNAYTSLGYSKPDWEFGLTNTIAYKNFSLSFQFDGRIGGVLINGVEAKLWEGGMHKSSANSYRDDAYKGIASYIGNGVVATSGTVEYDAFGNKISDSRKFSPNTVKVNYIDWIFATYTNGIGDAVLYKRSFVKLREVIFAYNLSPKLLSKTPFKGASFSIVGRNLILFTKVPFMDPDGYNNQDLAEPSYRNIGININLKF